MTGFEIYILAKAKLDAMESELGEVAEMLHGAADALTYNPADLGLLQVEFAARAPSFGLLLEMTAEWKTLRGDVEAAWLALTPSERRETGPPPGDLARDRTRAVV